MHINKISFKLSTETFGGDKEPTDVVEIYIDGKNLCDIIECSLPMWPGEIYKNLMKTYTLRDEPVNIFVCCCGCIGCTDTEVHIDETDHFVIWYGFIYNQEAIESDRIFVFDREQYYTEVDRILQWDEKRRLVHYLGNVFTIWSDEMRFKLLEDNISSLCTLKSDFGRWEFVGREEVLKILKRNFLQGDYEKKVGKNYLYRIHGHDGKMQARGYNRWYLKLARHAAPHEIVMYVVFKTDIEGKINEILLSRNKDWFKPCYWYASDV